MMLSSEDIELKICKTFCQAPRNGFDFDDEIWFENRSQHLLIKQDTGKDYKKEFQKPCGCLNLTQAGEYIRHMQMAISGHSNGQSLVSYNKRQSQEHLMECSDIISQTL